MVKPNQKIALITGANRGIGFEIARQLGARGIHTLMGARDPAKGRASAARLAAENLGVEFFHIDVADRTSIQDAADRIDRQFSRLDILVNNAGIAPDGGGSVMDVPAEKFEAALITNALGPLLLSRACARLMQRNQYGRIVNISSTLGSLTAMSAASAEEAATKVPAYRLSKAALNAVTTLLAMELKNFRILVNSACPGWVRTDMSGEQAPLSPAEGADTPVWLATLPDDGPSGGFFRERKAIPW
ncbi:MAG: SDR family oxidoreductase [Desulfobacteraceae bacterium]|nr:MAG: SDR family oxidoreductase [Desulfobacteraceae bacterium]